MSEAVRVENLRKVYGKGVEALRGVNLYVREGELVGLMGPSGSGKSTLLHIIAGLEKPTEGKVWVFGKDITSMTEDELSTFRRENIAFVFQFYYLMEDFSAYENLVIVGKLARIRDAEKKARELLEFLGLGNRLRHKPSELSGGEQQRVAIGRALMLEPKLILADEPTGNLDAEEGKRIMELFAQLRDQKGITFIIATHNQELEPYFDRVLRLKDRTLL